MTKDSSHTYIHLHRSHHADLLEDFNRTHLPHEEIYVPPQHQPLNPDDEDDIVPEQHAAFGIQRATQRQQEPAWRDLGLDRILNEGPPKTQLQNEQLSKKAAAKKRMGAEKPASSAQNSNVPAKVKALTAIKAKAAAKGKEPEAKRNASDHAETQDQVEAEEQPEDGSLDDRAT
ncbi:hypothetical protein E4T39_03309 [Aureobasidium subglaciale]|nr:hypothetical protein E4T39_03309 [Aureobasidium subglaciale]